MYFGFQYRTFTPKLLYLLYKYFLNDFNIFFCLVFFHLLAADKKRKKWLQFLKLTLPNFFFYPVPRDGSTVFIGGKNTNGRNWISQPFYKFKSLLFPPWITILRIYGFLLRLGERYKRLGVLLYKKPAKKLGGTIKYTSWYNWLKLDVPHYPQHLQFRRPCFSQHLVLFQQSERDAHLHIRLLDLYSFQAYSWWTPKESLVSEGRDLVRAGATNAWAPAHIWKWAPCNRPDKGAIIVKNVQTLIRPLSEGQ